MFPIKLTFLFGSPLGLFGAVYFEEPYIRSKLPTCDEFYNVFHPSDLVANRLEPLIKQYDYPDYKSERPSRVGEGSIACLTREYSPRNLEDDDEMYRFGEEELSGPVLVPWYKNHGLCKSQQLLKFFSD